MHTRLQSNTRSTVGHRSRRGAPKRVLPLDVPASRTGFVAAVATRQKCNSNRSSMFRHRAPEPGPPKLPRPRPLLNLTTNRYVHHVCIIVTVRRRFESILFRNSTSVIARKLGARVLLGGRTHTTLQGCPKSVIGRLALAA